MDKSMDHSNHMTLPIFIVDAFAKKAFEGNGAAVCPVPFRETLSPEIKQKIASEMNLSETAFISPLKESDTFEKGNRFALQWFTPKCEVALCGHATLATAAVLFSVFDNKSLVLEFETLSGILKAKQLPEGKIEIDLPFHEPIAVDFKDYEKVIKAAVGSLPVHEVVRSNSINLLIRLKDDVTREQFEKLQPNDAELLSGASDLMGVIVTLKGSSLDDFRDGQAYDFFSRYFAPWCGVSEDPVCGSAHSLLGPFWSRILKKNELYARQCSRRGGNINVKLMPDRVLISGYATVVVRGQINF